MSYVALKRDIKYNARMEKSDVKIREVITKLVFLSVFVILLVVLILLKTNSEICEAWTRGFARYYETAIGSLFKWVPFSLTEVIIVLLVVIGIVLLVKSIKAFVHKRPKEGISKLLSIATMVIVIFGVYQATAEMAYNREKNPVIVYEEKVDKTEFRKIIDYFVEDCNKVTAGMQFDEEGELICPYSLWEMNDLLAVEFDRLQEEYGDYFTPFTTRVKPMASSFIYRELHITGVTFMPTTEANVNYLNVNALKPTTAAHEILHTKGVMKEEDADFIALYLMLTSKNSYFRYSGYYFSLSSLLTLANYTGVSTDYSEVINSIDINLRKNGYYGYNYWKKHNAFADFGNWINDIYLKLSGEKEGVDSYNDTPIDVDEKTEEVITFSLYQKLYFRLYYEANPQVE